VSADLAQTANVVDTDADTPWQPVASSTIGSQEERRSYIHSAYICCVGGRFVDGQCTVVRRQHVEGSTGPEPDHFAETKTEFQSVFTRDKNRGATAH